MAYLDTCRRAVILRLCNCTISSSLPPSLRQPREDCWDRLPPPPSSFSFLAVGDFASKAKKTLAVGASSSFLHPPLSPSSTTSRLVPTKPFEGLKMEQTASGRRLSVALSGVQAIILAGQNKIAISRSSSFPILQ